MNKADLIKKMAEDAGISKSAAGIALESILKQVRIALSEDDEVRIFGFGTFKKSHRKAKTISHPRTGKAVKRSANKVVSFKPAKRLKDAVGGGTEDTGPRKT